MSDDKLSLASAVEPLPPRGAALSTLWWPELGPGYEGPPVPDEKRPSAQAEAAPDFARASLSAFSRAF